MVNSIVIVHEKNVIMSGEVCRTETETKGTVLRESCRVLCVERGGEPRWYFLNKNFFLILCWVDKVLKGEKWQENRQRNEYICINYLKFR